ncbi:AAA family ATPase [Paenibacillus sediminis]|uniref:Adenylate kinase family enzyme n=1 Tax=Paenibacillus sediminis TaxID=664909 RepID=A0ABS4H322_9BACL|nr:AAA family ATPase [Paenibacillus sediminis]MBP1936918.1 adenylate kinase family enzyme [Paenibacillus sediminis]
MNEKKICIIGSMGSGKTTIAKKISSRTQIPLYQTDNFVWDRSEFNKKYPAHVRDEILIKARLEDAWIIEGAHYQWGFESFEQADVIFILNPYVFIRDWRMVKRFIKTRVGWKNQIISRRYPI